MKPARKAAVALALTALIGAASTTAAQAAPTATTSPDMHQVTCGTRTDWFRMWTEYHGSPICYSSAGTTYYGNNPPVDTWTTYYYCSGNNAGTVTYWYMWQGTWQKVTETFPKYYCEYFYPSSSLGEAVEMSSITIN